MRTTKILFPALFLILFSFAANALTATQIKAYVVGAWEMENNGTDSAFGNDGFVMNAPTFISNCIQGGCYNFSNYTKQAIMIKDATQYALPYNFTVCAWVNVHDAVRYQNWVGQGIEDGGANDKFRLSSSNTAGNLTPVLFYRSGSYDDAFGTHYYAKYSWYHYCGVYFGNGTMAIYVNGTHERSKTITNGSTNPTINITICMNMYAVGTASSRYCSAMIDQVVLLNSSSPDVITSLYNNGLGLDLYGVNSTVPPEPGNNTAPVNSNAFINASSNMTYSSFDGYCNATDAENQSLNYYFQWYRDGVLNRSGYVITTYSYQDEGHYKVSGYYSSLADILPAIDRDFSTYLETTGLSFDLEVNFTLPINTTNATVRIKTRFYDSNYEAPLDCYVNNTLKLSLYNDGDANALYGRCYNSTIQLVNFVSISGSRLYGVSVTFSLNQSQNVNKTTFVSSFFTPVPGNYTFKCLANDGILNATSYLESAAVEIFGTIKPRASFNAGNFFSTDNNTIINNYTSHNARLNITLTDDYDLYSYEITVYNASKIIYTLTNTSLSGTVQYINRNITLNTSEGRYYFRLNVTDSHTIAYIPEWTIEKENNKLTFEARIKIEAVGAVSSSYEKYPDRYSFSFQYDKVLPIKTYYIESDSTLIYRQNSKYKGHFVDFKNKKWIDFENEAGQVQVTKLKDNRWQVDVLSGEKEIEFQSIGGLNVESYTYSYFMVGVPSITWLYPESNPGYIVNGSINATVNVTGTYLNNTYLNLYNSSNALIESYSSTNNVNGTITVGYTFSSLTGRNYTIQAYHMDSYGNRIYSSNRTIYNYIIDNCSSTSTIVGYVYFYNEEDPTIDLPTYLELEIEYPTTLSGNRTKYNAVHGDSVIFDNNSHNYTICMYPPTSTPVYADIYFKYYSEGGFIHRYYLFNQSVSNATFSVNMYNFNRTDDISDLKITNRYAANYRYFIGAVGSLERYYLDEGVWRIVQMSMSDDYGLMLFHVMEQDIDYRITFRDSYNNILKQTDSLKFLCTSGVCDLTSLLANYTASSPSTNLVYSWSYSNDTQNLTLLWSDITGLTHSVRLEVTKETSAGTLSICNSTKTGSSGSIVCSLATITGIVLVNVYSTASPERPVISEWLSLPRILIGNLINKEEGSIWAFAILATVAGFGSALGIIGVLISMTLGMIMIYFVGILTPVTATVLVIVCVVGLVIGLKVRE